MSQEFVNKIFTRKIYDFYPLDTKRPYVTGNIRRSFLVRENLIGINTTYEENGTAKQIKR